MDNDGKPSQTALMAAAARAAHLIVDDEPRIFADTLAYTLLGDEAENLVRYHRLHGDHPILAEARSMATVRSRYTEDRLAEAEARGVTQYVILGAGLDTFAYRSGTGGLRVFEVDHPGTQEWKRERLEESDLALPGTVTFVPVDFETAVLSEALAEAGFDPSRPAFVSWLGVTMYLTREAIAGTLAEIGRFAPGTEIVTDSMLPAGLRDAEGQAYAEAVSSVAAERGEPWLSLFAPEDLSALLEEHGFGLVGHARPSDAIDAGLWKRTDSIRPSGLSLLTHATVLVRAR
ncbi:class I SAM-dependent methyltransferase [Actinoallomurus rhizosphaericola]|uniref:class I SAM-dependent methyltransferase n=1 Tax=Actinoallomurus rhizosphaericola TaxID=2952536 RepID=UPI0020901437|nr:SAM-dependent methyltransferase [Actinoallomurus rhizosphaericola]MCO5994151.1 class I SAM-dependent methyltransferase [Actinoallomurus rhizosphaericola]